MKLTLLREGAVIIVAVSFAENLHNNMTLCAYDSELSGDQA